MTKKMIALDLDGTLLRSDNTISDYTVEGRNRGPNGFVAG